jgi:hypothetical protein
VDNRLYKTENYEEFLEKRRGLLAESTNNFLNSLNNNSVEQVEIHDYANRTVQAAPKQDEETLILEVACWMLDQGLSEGEINYELTDDAGNVLMIIDIAWPQGIQSGLSEPVAFLINESIMNQEIVNKHGFRYFTNPDEFKTYVKSHYLP